MIVVALAVLAATAAGVLLEHRTSWAQRAAQACLTLMLYVLVPFVSYVSFAHLRLSVGAGVGLGVAYCGLGLAGLLTWWFGRRLGTARATLGGMIVCALIVNTGYLGYPMTVALLGSGALVHAVTYDQVVSAPMLFTGGFAVGAAFGRGDSPTLGRRVRAFFTRNPPLWAAVTGLLVPTAWAPQVLVNASHVVVDGLLVAGFLAVGVFLSSERREDHARLLEMPSRPVLVALIGRFCVTSALLAAVALAGVGIPRAYLLESLMPSGITSLLIGHVYGLDQRMIATVIVWATILVLVVGTVLYVV